MVGIGAIVLSGARIGAGTIVGAGSVVLEGTRVPPGVLVVGAPARMVRSVTERDLRYIRSWVAKYVRLAKSYREKYFSPPAKDRVGTKPATI